MATTLGAISAMCKRSGMSRINVSKSMGRNDTYIQSLLGKRATPSGDILAEIAAVCGYQLQLVGHGETIVIDPPTRD